LLFAIRILTFYEFVKNAYKRMGITLFFSARVRIKAKIFTILIFLVIFMATVEKMKYSHGWKVLLKMTTRIEG